MGRVIIEHADGRRYSVERAAAKELYPDFAIVGDETPADFIADVPRPTRRRGARRKTVSTAASKAPASEPEAEA